MGERTVLFHPEAGAYRIIYNEVDEYVTGICCFLQRERSHGLYGFATFSRESAADHSADFFDYDGHAYRRVLTLGEQSAGDGSAYHSHITVYGTGASPFTR